MNKAVEGWQHTQCAKKPFLHSLLKLHSFRFYMLAVAIGSWFQMLIQKIVVDSMTTTAKSAEVRDRATLLCMQASKRQTAPDARVYIMQKVRLCQNKY